MERYVTRLAIQQNDKERVNVYLDGSFAFGLALEEALQLKVGQALSEEDIAALQNVDAYHKAYHQSLDLLSRRPYSTAEVRQNLTKKGVLSVHIDRILSRLTDSGLLDDATFARFWIENRDAFRPRGVQALRFELRQKGVEATIIDQVLEDLDFDEDETAYRAGEKLLPRIRSIEDPWQFQQKVAAALSRRGFRWEVIRRVSDRLWAIKDQDDLP